MKFLSQINVNTEYNLPIVDGTNGQVLTTDGTGAVYWGSVSVGALNLDGLSDVVITSPASGQILRYGIPVGSEDPNPVWYNWTPNFVTTADAVTITGTQTITGSKTFTAATTISSATSSVIPLTITKGGNGEGLIVNKTSGSGNAVTIAGTLQATTIVKTGGTSSQFLKADGSVDTNTYLTSESDTLATVTGRGAITSSALTLNGNVSIGTSAALSFGNATRQMVNLWSTQYGIGVQSSTQYFRTGGGFAWFLGGVHSNTANDPGGGTLSMRIDSSSNLIVTGSVTASSFIKSGGTASQFLKADGSVDSNTYLTAHPAIVNGGSVNNSNGTVIQDITLETNGHVTAITSVDLDTRYYTENEITGIFGGEIPMAGYNLSNWDTAYSWGNHAGLYAPLSHNHTSLTGVTSIGFAAQSSDSASITTTISGTSTFFDFNLTDDNNNDWWRWRFTPSGSTVYDAMTLKPLTNGNADLTISGSVFADNLAIANWNTAYGWGDHDGLYASIATEQNLTDLTNSLGSAAYEESTSFAAASHTHAIADVTGLQTALNAKAPLASPALTGVPTAPTAAAGTNTTQIATTAYVRTAITNLVDAAPATLDTLNELAAALGDDPNFATTVTNSIGTKVSKAGDTMTGALVTPRLSLTNDASDTFGHRVTVFDSGGTSYGMMLWNSSGTSGDWSTMIYGPNQANRRISFGKVNTTTPTNHSHVTEIAYFDLDDSHLYTDGRFYPSAQTINYVDSTRIANWQTAYGWGNHDGLYASIATEQNLVDLTNSLGSAAYEDSTAFAAASHTHTIANVTGLQGALDAKLSLSGGTVTGLTIFEDGLRIGTGNHSTDGRASITFGEGTPTSDSMYIEYDGENLSGVNNAIIIGSEASGDIFRVTYGGSVIATTFTGALSGNATTATTLATARTLTIGNTGKTFNGSANVSWSLAEIGAASSTHNHDGVYLGVSDTAVDSDKLGGLASSSYYLASNPSGYITSASNITGTSAGVVRTVTGTTSAELVRGNMGDNDQARILVGATASNAGYLEIATADDGTEPIYVRQYTGVFSTLTRTATLLDGSGNTSFPGTVTASTFSGALSGNATTATTLQNTRTINGTNFNGSANITTATWGTARTVTIGSTGKSVNGGANVSWTLGEIGAAAASHTHGISSITDSTRWWNNFGDNHTTRTAFDATTPSYGFGWRYVQGSTNGPGTSGNQFYSLYVGLGNDYPATGAGSYGMYLAIDRNVDNPYLSVRYNENNSLGSWRKIWAGRADFADSAGTATTATTTTGNAGSATILQTTRTINGTNFNGSANITTATWGTARTITIGNTGKSVNGGANVAWTIAEIGALALTGGNLSGALSLPTGTNLLFAGGSDTNWRIGRNIITESSNNLTSNTLQFIAAASAGQGWQFVGSTGITRFEIDASNGKMFFNGTEYDYVGSSVALRSNAEFSFLTRSNAAQKGRFGGIQVSTSYSGTVPNNGILFFTDTTLTRINANELTTNADFVPSVGDTYNLGREDARWRTVYCNTLDSAGLHESNLSDDSIGKYNTGVVLVWKEGKMVPCSKFADHMRMGIAVKGNNSPLVQGAEPVLCTGDVLEGQYLVSSDTVGHAVAVDRSYVVEHQLFDCVIGKALESKSGESFVVKTWVNI